LTIISTFITVISAVIFTITGHKLRDAFVIITMKAEAIAVNYNNETIARLLIMIIHSAMSPSIKAGNQGKEHQLKVSDRYTTIIDYTIIAMPHQALKENHIYKLTKWGLTSLDHNNIY
jgi:hypothetical protein